MDNIGLSEPGSDFVHSFEQNILEFEINLLVGYHGIFCSLWWLGPLQLLHNSLSVIIFV